MKRYLRYFRQTITATFDFRGRARREEVIGYIVTSAALAMLTTWLVNWLAPEAAARWTLFAVQVGVLVPAASLAVRRIHDLGRDARWAIVFLVVAIRNIALDLLDLLGGWEARRVVESALSHVDWVLFLPFVALYLLALVAPGTKGGNRFGPDPRGMANLPPPKTETAGAESSAPAV